MSSLVSLFIQSIRSQGSIFAYLIILPICVINTLPFLTLLFPLSKTKTRIILLSVIGIDTALIAVASGLTHRLIHNMGYDTWMHLAIIQRGVENGLFAGDPYYAGFPNTLHYSIVDVFYILLSKITGIAPHILWGNLSFLSIALIFLVCVWWYKELFEDSRLGWFAGFLFILSISIKWHYATYPRNIALIFFFLSLLFYFRSVKNKYILYCGISFGFCIMSHLFTGIMCWTFLIAYILLTWGIDAIHRKKRLWREELKRLAFIPIGCVVASPWLIIFGKQALAHTEKSMSHYSIPAWHSQTTILGQTFTIYKPKMFLEVFPIILWILAGIGFLICLYHIIRGNYRPIHIFLVFTAIIPVVVLLSPLYMLIVRVFGEWMPPRFVRVMSIPPLAVLSCGMIIRFFAGFRSNHKIQRSIIRSFGIIPALVFVIVVVSPITIMQRNLYRGRDQVLTPLYTWDSDFYSLKDTIKDKVVITDPTTSYFLTYYTSAYVVAIPSAHGSPYINHEARNSDVYAVFNPNTDPARRYELLNKYQVEYVMLNLRARTDSTASRYGGISGFYPDAVREIFDRQERFKLIYDVNGLLVYKYCEILRCAQNDKNELAIGIILLGNL